DNITQEEVGKLLIEGYLKQIQFPKCLSNVVLVLKLGNKWPVCVDFRDVNKAYPKDFYPLPCIDQVVDSTSGYELLSLMDASQGYHEILLKLDNQKH
ncbi:UNVERIFIED_CONTAM: hypothetical protein Sindi_1639100, partial [Sesamum indicum]